MPMEIYSERGRTAINVTIIKMLFYDILRQSWRPGGLTSIDAESCYESIAHSIASLVFRAYGVQQGAVETMLMAIEDMKYFLRTAYGDSTTCSGSSIKLKFQGLCQGNGAAPAGWTVITITMIRAHKKKGYGAKFVCPLTLRKKDVAAILFVDDTDLLHFDIRHVHGQIGGRCSCLPAGWSTQLGAASYSHRRRFLTEQVFLLHNIFQVDSAGVMEVRVK